MKDKFRSFIKSDLVRNSSILVSGGMIGQVIAFLATMVLTRIYTDEDFGSFALFMSVASILGHFGTGKYEEAIVLSKTKREAHALVGFINTWLPIFSLFLFVVLFFFRKPIFSLLHIEAIHDFWFLLPVMAFVVSLSNILTGLANREKRFKAIAGASVTQNTASSLSKIAISPVFPNAWGLLSGQILSYVLSCLAFFRLRKDVFLSFKQKWANKKKAAIEYKDFPKFNLPRNVLNSISFNLPFLMLTSLFGEAQLGLFFLAFNTSFRPINLVVNSIYLVLYERSAQLKNKGEKISPLLNVYVKNNLLYILPCFVLLFIFSPQIFSIMFSEEWKASGIYLRYLLPWLYMILFTAPLGFIPLLMKKQKAYMWFEILYFIFRVLGIYIGILQKNFHLAIILFAAVGFTFMTIQYIWYRWTIKRYEKSIKIEPVKE
ncbi:oligosaccharide flippase family protein [Bacteroidales bacterium OttesenSCG-928-M11]|nr:oligosaccharide flippase family protein [Bacteroidales bacterium OttesenSCG-928-M11]